MCSHQSFEARAIPLADSTMPKLRQPFEDIFQAAQYPSFQP
jgi:hypothetical protein